MNDNNNKTLCGQIEEELQVKDPKTYIALVQPTTHYIEAAAGAPQKLKTFANQKNCSKRSS